MPARLGDGEGPSALDRGAADQAAAPFGGTRVDRMDVSVPGAEGDDTLGAAARCLKEPVAIRRVVGDDRDAGGLEPLEDFRFGIGNHLFRAEILDVRRSDRGNQRDVRAYLRRQRADLAGIVHADFEHGILDVARHPREAQGHTGVIVVTLDRAVNLARAIAVERCVERFLGAGFADRAGDSEDRCLAALARSAAECLQRREGVRHEDVRPAYRLRHDRAGSARGEGAVDELVPVIHRARHGDEQVAGPDFAAVESDAGDFERRARHSPGRGRDFIRRPERGHAAHSRATSASSNGSTLSPMIWPVSWPLPATRTMSPSRAMRIASAMASRRPATSVAPAAPAMMSARMRPGSSLRGLSSVTMTTSDKAVATRPICGRLPWSRSPPAPNTVINRPSTWGRSAAMAASSASGV